MQISTNELINLLAKTQDIAVGKILEKQKEKEKNTPKRKIVQIQVMYEHYDCEKDITTYSYNLITTHEGTNAVNIVLNNLQILYEGKGYHYKYDPIKMEFTFFDKDEKDVFIIRRVYDRIIGVIEL